jgi:hypothetical protein
VKQGVIDPAKVVRTALQDAASVAGLLVTTEAMVAQKPNPKTPPPVRNAPFLDGGEASGLHAPELGRTDPGGGIRALF